MDTEPPLAKSRADSQLGVRVVFAMTRTYEFDFRLRSVLNARMHWAALHRYMRESKAFTAAYWNVELGAWRPALPCRVTLTRIAHKAMDGDNLQGAFKGCRDQLAKLIGVDDADPRVQWRYGQRKGSPRKYAVEITIEETHD